MKAGKSEKQVPSKKKKERKRLVKERIVKRDKVRGKRQKNMMKAGKGKKKEVNKGKDNYETQRQRCN